LTTDCYSREIQQAPNGRWHIPSTDTSPWLCLSTAAPPLGAAGQSSAMRPRAVVGRQQGPQGQQRGISTIAEDDEEYDVVCTNPFEREQ